jgi:polynucleotide 5'-hydroxyl-kinase GRC3/NOL9
MYNTVRVRMVKGPAEVVVNGICNVLGSDVSGQTVKVRPGKALPFELSNRCSLQAHLGYGARLWWALPNQAGTLMWRKLARQVFALAARDKKIIVLLVGGADTGKSTLTLYLANMAIRIGHVPCIIDGDVGQGDLAPPTAIGAAIFSKQVVDLRDVSATRMYEFIGSITPAGFEDVIATKLRSMLDKAIRLASIVIVNTDGYVSNGGLNYKEVIAKKLHPDVILLLGQDSALFDMLAPGSWKILRARSNDQTYKSGLDRLSRRLDQFLRYVGNSSSTAELSQVKIENAVRLFSPSEPGTIQSPLKQLDQDRMNKMFVGLGSNGVLVGFGIIISVAPDRGILHLQTDISSFDTIYLSNIRLTRDGIIKIRLI